MTDSTIRVRFAPSPTGDFHVGGARTALFNYLFARHHGGTFILRIEDTDQQRFHPEALKWLLDGLTYLGLDWDEGPEKGGDYGPYTQSERLDIYNEQVKTLISNGKAYPCFCTPERLAEVIEQQKREKSSWIGYDRHCRHLDSEDVKRRLKRGEPHVIRFKMPLEGETVVKDAIRGEIRFTNRELQDAVLIKSDGFPTYHFANVVDDHFMAISHILRGDEWVNSLPLHWQLYDAFGWDPPVMAHLPVILNPSGKGKMSKRADRAPDGTLRPVFVRQYEEAGYLPEALVNFMALVGWSFDDSREIFSREELIQAFSLDRVHKSPAVWNYDKLNQINGQYIRRLSLEELEERIFPILEKAGLDVDRQILTAAVPLIQERLVVLSDCIDWLDFFFREPDPLPPERLIPKKGTVEGTLTALKEAQRLMEIAPFDHQSLYEKFKARAAELGLKPGFFFQPVRLAVCGKPVAPPLFETLEILGRETSIARVTSAGDRFEHWVKHSEE